MSRLRCHELDRRDELDMILSNRLLPSYVMERRKIEIEVEEAQAKLDRYDRYKDSQDRWIRLLQDSLAHHWIDNPDQYIKDWEAANAGKEM
jgi:hypothetical protein